MSQEQNPYQAPLERDKPELSGKPKSDVYKLKIRNLALVLASMVSVVGGAILGAVLMLFALDWYWSRTPTPRGIAEDWNARAFGAAFFFVPVGLMGGAFIGSLVAVLLLQKRRKLP